MGELQDNSPNDGDVMDFFLEIAMLSQLNHPNIVRFWRGSTEMHAGSRSLLMVTEYIKQGGLTGPSNAPFGMCAGWCTRGLFQRFKVYARCFPSHALKKRWLIERTRKVLELSDIQFSSVLREENKQSHKCEPFFRCVLVPAEVVCLDSCTVMVGRRCPIR